ncbi:hypothetical protein [Gemmatimonas sp.]
MKLILGDHRPHDDTITVGVGADNVDTASGKITEDIAQEAVGL